MRVRKREREREGQIIGTDVTVKTVMIIICGIVTNL